jgi:hypothetical protein
MYCYRFSSGVGYILLVVWLVLGFENMHLHGSIPSDPGFDSRGARYHLKQIKTSGGVAPFLTQQPNGAHVSYPPYDQGAMLAKAFDPVVRNQWFSSEHPQMIANEEQAAARGMQIWAKHDGHVFPTENMVTYIGNNNVIDDGKGGHDWEEPNGYAVVDAHHQAVAHHLNAAAYHQQAAAHFQHHTY